MKSTIMYGVEHCDLVKEISTYEIFTTLEEAQDFCNDNENWSKDRFPLRIFKADFNVNRIFQEDDNVWNYDDFSDTILKYHDFEIIINPTPEFG